MADFPAREQADFPAREQLDQLADKLSKLEGSLTPEERAILLGVFGMARAGFNAAVGRAQRSHPHAKITQQVAKPTTLSIQSPAAEVLPSLGQGFQSAFVAGKAGDFSLGGLSPIEDSVGVSVGGVCVSVSWSADLKEAFVASEVIDLSS